MAGAAMTPVEAAERHGEETVRAAARAALWRAGDPRYFLHVGQRDAFAAMLGSPIRRFVLVTGRRWGKSRLMAWICALFIAIRLRHCAGVTTWPAYLRGSWLLRDATRTRAPARVVYAAPTRTMVAEFIDPHFRLLAEQLPEDLRPARSPMGWQWPDGSRVVLGGCEDTRKADRLRGPEADLAVIDEGGFIPILGYVAKSVVGPQLWETRGRMLMPSTPPEGADHEFVDLYAEARSLGATFHARTADAPHITAEALAEAIADAGGEESADWQREGEARIIRDPREAVFPEWPQLVQGEPHPYIAEHPRPEHFIPIVIGDAGYVDLTVVLFGYHDFAADLDVIEDEVVLRHSTSEQIDRAVRAREAALWPDHEVSLRAIDASPQVRADLSSARYQSITPQEPPTPWDVVVGHPGAIADGPAPIYWQPVRKDDLHAAVNALRVRIARGKLRVHTRCQTLVAHLEHARWNRTRTEFARPQAAEHHYDAAAAAVYMCRMIDRAASPYGARRRPEGVAADDWYTVPAREQRIPFTPRMPRPTRTR